MAINYGDLECSPWSIARQEAAADAILNEGFCHTCHEELGFEECQCDELAFEAAEWAREMRDLEY
jgi:hypothetical protein